MKTSLIKLFITIIILSTIGQIAKGDSNIQDEFIDMRIPVRENGRLKLALHAKKAQTISEGNVKMTGIDILK